MRRLLVKSAISDKLCDNTAGDSLYRLDGVMDLSARVFRCVDVEDMLSNHLTLWLRASPNRCKPSMNLLSRGSLRGNRRRAQELSKMGGHHYGLRETAARSTGVCMHFVRLLRNLTESGPHMPHKPHRPSSSGGFHGATHRPIQCCIHRISTGSHASLTRCLSLSLPGELPLLVAPIRVVPLSHDSERTQASQE